MDFPRKHSSMLKYPKDRRSYAGRSVLYATQHEEAHQMTATPWGFRDILPEEAQAREEIALYGEGLL